MFYYRAAASTIAKQQEQEKLHLDDESRDTKRSITESISDIRARLLARTAAAVNSREKIKVLLLI